MVLRGFGGTFGGGVRGMADLERDKASVIPQAMLVRRLIMHRDITLGHFKAPPNSAQAHPPNRPVRTFNGLPSSFNRSQVIRSDE
jgi:hypothetical protein